MKKTLLIAAVAGLSLVLGTGAAMAGDTCGTASVLLEGISNGDLGGNSSQWYSFTPGTSTEFVVNTGYAGTQFVASLAVFGSCGGQMLGANEGTPGRNAIVRLPMDGGQTYFIEIGKVNENASSGTAFQIGVSEAALGGCPGAGDCFAANGTPGCDDTCGGSPCPTCCDTICGLDPFCCTNSWDTICQGEAISFCVVVPVELQSFDVDSR